MNPELHSLSGAYALDALDGDERAAFEEHLHECASCRAEVASFAEVTPLLAAPEETPPPAGLRERILAEASTTRQLPPLVRDTETAPDAVPPAAAPGDDGERRAAAVTPLRRRLVVALAAAAALVLGGTAAWQVLDGDETTQTVPLAQQVMDAEDAVEHVADVSGGGRVSVVSSESMGRMVVVGHDLPDAAQGHGYQAWLQDEAGAMHPSAMVPADGSPALLTGETAGMTGVGITLEPSAGSPEPTTDPVALVTV